MAIEKVITKETGQNVEHWIIQDININVADGQMGVQLLGYADKIRMDAGVKSDDRKTIRLPFIQPYSTTNIISDIEKEIIKITEGEIDWSTALIK
jgi:hypothetical protein